MPKVIILGSSNAVPSKDHENTHLVIVGEERTILVDCVSNPIVRLEQAGIEHTFLETEGAHHWRVWRRYLRDLAPLLFK